MKPFVLLFNIASAKKNNLMLTCLRLGVTPVPLDSGCADLTLVKILEGQRGSASEQSFGGELLIMCGFASTTANLFLSELRRNKVFIPLKAMLTETNKAWTPRKLYSELKAEREAIEKGKSAHAQEAKK